jgi:hypothetical protein
VKKIARFIRTIYRDVKKNEDLCMRLRINGYRIVDVLKQLERRDVDQTVLVIPGSFRLFSLERGKYY